MRKIVIAVAAVSLLLVAACDPQDGSPSKPKATNQAAKPPAAVPPPVGGGGAKPPHVPEVDRPGPQADPGSCADQGKERDVELYAHWTSETDKTPSIVWTHNGVQTPATNVISLRNGPGKLPYGGEWSKLQHVKCHDVLGIKLIGNPSMVTVVCAIIDLGDGPVKTGQRNCDIPAYTVV